EVTLIGILGESISEEQAREILESGIDFRDQHPWLKGEKPPIFKNYRIGYKLPWFDTALESLTSLIESKGVKVTNPKPEFNYNESAFSVPYSKKLEAWQQSES